MSTRFLGKKSLYSSNVFFLSVDGMDVRTVNATFSEDEFQALLALKRSLGYNWEQFIREGAALLREKAALRGGAGG